MKRTVLALFLVGLGISVPAFAGPQDDAFFAMDTSGDGTVSQDEYIAFATTRARSSRAQATRDFAALARGDNRITIVEFRQGPERAVPRRRAAPSTPRPRPPRSSVPRGGGFGS